jgi:hypothetical protein
LTKGGILVFKNRLIASLKNRNMEKYDAEVSKAIIKMEKQKRLSSKEFLKSYETLWKEGPAVKYRNIGSKEMLSPSTIQNPTLW